MGEERESGSSYEVGGGRREGGRVRAAAAAAADGINDRRKL